MDSDNFLDFEITANFELPYIKFHSKNNQLEISGRLLPEDPQLIFEKLTSWLKQYIDQGLSNLTVSLQLDYFNTASARMLYIFLKEVLNHDGFSVVWRFAKTDYDMLEAGKEIAEVIAKPFKYEAF